MQKAGCKKQSHCYSKREEAALPLLFLNNNDPVFLHPAFFSPYFGPNFFSVSQTHPCFQYKNSGCRLTGQDSLRINVESFRISIGPQFIKQIIDRELFQKQGTYHQLQLYKFSVFFATTQRYYYFYDVRKKKIYIGLSSPPPTSNYESCTLHYKSTFRHYQGLITHYTLFLVLLATISRDRSLVKMHIYVKINTFLFISQLKICAQFSIIINK